MSWLPFFVAITALAFVAQAAAITLIYFQFKRTSERVERIASDIEVRVVPILVRAQILIEDAQPRITSVMADAAEIEQWAIRDRAARSTAAAIGARRPDFDRRARDRGRRGQNSSPHGARTGAIGDRRDSRHSNWP